MNYLYISIITAVSFIVAHFLILKLSADTVADYLSQTRMLLDSNQYTDGCTIPFKTYIHNWLSKSYLLCAAHDFGSLGYITGVRAGWHNNIITWLTHMSETNPIYWVWGTVVALFTLPWVIWRRNLNIKFMDMGGFYIVLFIIVAIYFLIKYQPVS